MTDRPEIVCICGSMRFAEEMRTANRELTFAGAIALSDTLRSSVNAAFRLPSGPSSHGNPAPTPA